MGDIRTFLQNLTAGVGTASNTPAGTHAARVIEDSQQRQRDAQTQNLTMLQDAAKKQQLIAAHFTDPTTGKAYPQYQPQYDDAMNRFSGLAGQIYESQHPDPGSMSFEHKMGIRALSKMHLTNDLNSRIKKWKDMEGTFKDNLAAGGQLPYGMTPEGDAEAAKNGNTMEEIKARGENKLGSEKAVWLKGEDGQERPFELKNGAYVPIATPGGEQRAGTPESDYQKAQLEFKNKDLEFQRLKQEMAANPNNPTIKASLERAAAELQRAQAQMIRAKAGASGTDLQGNPLPGAVTDASGNPVGSMFAGNIKPTGVELQRADLAGSTLEQIDDVTSLIKKRPDLFGPAAGRWTDFNQWLGSQDPDAQRFKAAVDTIASHLSGVYGARGAYSQEAIAKTIGKNRTNPAALAAALDQYAVAARNIKAKGTRHTVGGNPQNPEGPSGQIHQELLKTKQQGGGGSSKMKVKLSDGRVGTIDAGDFDPSTMTEVQ